MDMTAAQLAMFDRSKRMLVQDAVPQLFDPQEPVHRALQAQVPPRLVSTLL